MTTKDKRPEGGGGGGKQQQQQQQHEAGAAAADEPSETSGQGNEDDIVVEAMDHEEDEQPDFDDGDDNDDEDEEEEEEILDLGPDIEALMMAPPVEDPEGYYADTSIFENKAGLSDDMRFLASMPELCDVTFLVGETREPVCAVRAVLAARSKVFQKLVYAVPKEQQSSATGGAGQTKEQAAAAAAVAGQQAATVRAASKLRAFIKRSSEPLLSMQPQPKFTSTLSTVQEPPSAPAPSDHPHQTLIIEEFEPDVFRQLIEYVHTGCVTLQPRTLLGVMNAADYYGLDELKKACSGFIQCCVNVDTVCALLATAERYIQYKCTKSLVQKVLEFVDEHGNEVLNLGSFALLPQHVVRLILTREDLKADEFSKFQAALMWSKKYCDSTNSNIHDVLGSFLEYIHFHMIPANVLMKEIHPLGLVPSHVIMTALAYQADPTSVDPLKVSPHKPSSTGRAQGGTARGLRRGTTTAASTAGAAAAAATGARSMSVQSAKGHLFGSNTTLSSTTSSTSNMMPVVTEHHSQQQPPQHSPSRCSSISRYSN